MALISRCSQGKVYGLISFLDFKDEVFKYLMSKELNHHLLIFPIHFDLSNFNGQYIYVPNSHLEYKQSLLS